MCDESGKDPVVWLGSVIGVVHTPFAAKFGAPRQTGVVPEAEGWVCLHPPYDRPEALAGLEQCSHLWLLYGFHQVPAAAQPRLTVRPPRLGGNRRLGVFATRSPFRPNPIGLSAVRLVSVHPGVAGRPPDRGHLRVTGVDMVDGTPLLDIKPYLPWADALTEAQCSWAGDRPRGLADLTLIFAGGTEKQLSACMEKDQGFAGLLEQTLRADPRPSYQTDKNGRNYAMTLADVHVRWRVDADAIVVLALLAQDPGAE